MAGFRSFHSRTEFSLARSGLIYVTGLNEIEPELETNAVGKSSLFEALFWCCFGKTSRNLRAGNVATWGGTERCSVLTRFVRDGVPHKLRRGWKPNKLLLDGEPVDQQKIEQVLGFSPETFLYAVYHAQFVKHFVDLQPAEQLQLFSAVLRLDLWDDASDLAKHDCDDLTREAQDAEKRVVAASTELRVLSDTLDERIGQEALWLRTAKVKIGQSRAVLVDLRKQKRAVETDLARRTAKRAKTTQGELIAKVLRKVSVLQVKQRAAVKGLADAESERRRWEQQVDRLSGKVTCPTCLQPIDRKLFATTCTKHWDTAKQELTDWGRYEVSITDRLDAQQKKLERLREQARVDDEQQAELQRTVNSLTAGIQTQQERLGELLEQRCPYDTRALVKQVEAARIEYESRKITRDKVAQQVGVLEYWRTAFREIRLALVHDCLLQLEIQANAAMTALGLGHWHLHFAVEQETKGGTLRRAFNLLVETPEIDQPVPFEVWSGGESQRIRLAVAVALGDLIQDLSGLQTNIEIFDEPTQWLSGQGIDDLLEFLSQRARARGTAIYLADQRSYSAGYDSMVRIVKGVDGSIVEESEGTST